MKFCLFSLRAISAPMPALSPQHPALSPHHARMVSTQREKTDQ
uniref:Uncharacterized protein n=1 Tax=Bacillus subtilis TaxID=1423 RepID=A0AAX3RJK4_BACIU|nr:hypothetical protein P5633_00335 [Bacillus subtilis]